MQAWLLPVHSADEVSLVAGALLAEPDRTVSWRWPSPLYWGKRFTPWRGEYECSARDVTGVEPWDLHAGVKERK